MQEGSPDREITLFTIDEVKKFLKIGTNKAYELVAQKKIPSIKLGNSIRVPKQALLDWIEKETAKGIDISEKSDIISLDSNIKRIRDKKTEI